MNNQITIHDAHCTMQINLDLFFDRAVSLDKQRKLLDYLLRDSRRNEENINTLNTYLPQKQTEAKEAWDIASKQYQDEHISMQFCNDFTAKQKRAIMAANRKMMNAVNRSKISFERLGKIIAYYEMLKTKNHY